MPAYYPTSKLIAPIFIEEVGFLESRDHDAPELNSIAGFSRLNQAQAYQKVEQLLSTGISNVLIYPLFSHIERGPEIVPETLLTEELFLLPFVRSLKQRHPELQIVLDLCICHLNPSGQCGVMHEQELSNDLTLTALEGLAVRFAETGADALMLSGMVDGAVASVRRTLDRNGLTDTVLMVQSTKLDSSLYGPFQQLKNAPVRQALKSSYQLDPADRRQAVCEIRLDLCEGADVIVLKPVMNSIDLLAGFDRHTRPPLFGYMTGGEYALLRETLAHEAHHRLAQLNGWLKNLERAGLDAIFCYIAEEYAHLLSSLGRQTHDRAPELGR